MQVVFKPLRYTAEPSLTESARWPDSRGLRPPAAGPLLAARWGGLGGLLDVSWRALEGFLEALGASWGCLGASEILLEASWALLGPLGSVLEAS